MVDDSESDVSSGLVREAIRMQREEMEAEETNPGARQCGPCNWSKKDELTILQVLVEFKKGGGNVFKLSASWLEDAVKGKLDGHFSNKQLPRKVRKARDKFKRNSKPTAVLRNHESRIYELSSQLWGTNDNAAAAPFSPHSIIQLHSLLMLQEVQSTSSFLPRDEPVITQLYKRLNTTARDELEEKGREIQRRM